MNPPELTANGRRIFQADRKAWAFFESVAANYQRAMLLWIAVCPARERARTAVAKPDRGVPRSSEMDLN